jgi:4-amino-4-deoxy-L-arabinose transferase-like glycosyltransferase
MKFKNIDDIYIKLGIIIVSFIGFLFRVCLVWQPTKVLVEKNLPDDSFYYFLIAHNFTQNGMVSFDSINLTNGFHPLWLIIISPIYRLISPLSDIQVHITLTLACVLELFTFICIYKIVGKFSKRKEIGLLAIVYYAFNPAIIFQTTNGLETALEMLFLSLFLWGFLNWMENKLKFRWATVVGIISGLLFLARSDTIFFIIIFYGFVIITWGIFKYWKQIFISGIFALLTISPWIIWNYIVFGSFVQVSGIAVPYAIYQRFLEVNPGSSIITFIEEGIRQIFNWGFWMRGDPIGMPFIVGIIFWFFIIIDLIRRKNIPEFNKYKLFLALTISSGVCLIVVHAGIRWYPRPWYFIPTSLIFSIAFSMLFDRYQFNQNKFKILNILIFVYYLTTGYLYWNVGLYPWQKQMYQGAFWLKENIPDSLKVGSFNAGIYAFYSEKPIINLDGVVNNSAFEAIKNKNIIGYLAENRINYLIDYDSAIKNEYAPFMGIGYQNKLIENAIIDGDINSFLGLLRVYKLSVSP